MARQRSALLGETSLSAEGVNDLAAPINAPSVKSMLSLRRRTSGEGTADRLLNNN
jgi:hypothetical protein